MTTAQPAAPHPFDIPAGNLTSTLSRFARIAGVKADFDPTVTQAHNSAGLQGEYTLEEGFSALLRGTGLVAIPVGAGHYRIDPIIPGARPDSGSVIMLDTVKVHASDHYNDAYETPAAVHVIEREALERLPARDTSEVLATVAGVSTSQSRQDPGVSVNIRGLQDFGRVNAMVDGTRQNFQRSGHGANGSVYLDPQLLGSVEITKGPSSTLGGAAVIGGTVDFQTLEFDDLVHDGDSGGRLHLTAGDNAYHFSGSAAGAWRVRDNLDLVTAVGRKEVGEFSKGSRGGNAGSDSYWDGTSRFTSQDQWSGLLKATARLAPHHTLKLGYIGFSSVFDEGSNTFADSDATSESRIRNDTLSLRYDWSPDNDYIDLTARLYFTRTGLDQHQAETGDPTNPYGEFSLRYETNTLGGALSNRALLDLSPLTAVLTLDYGAEFYHDWTRPEATRETEGSGRAAWFAGPTPEGKRNVASLFSQADLAHANGLNLIAGLRYDYFTLAGEGEMYVGSIDNPPGVRPHSTDIYTRFKVSRHKGYISPTLTAAYLFGEALQIYASSGRGARPPAITESLLWGSHVGDSLPFFPNPGLEAERSFNREIGMNLNLSRHLGRDHSLRVKTAWFDNRVDHFMTQARVIGPAGTSDGSRAVAYVNLRDQVRFYGPELQAEYRYGPVFAEAAWTRTHVDLGEGGYDPFPLGSLVGYPPTLHGEADGDSLMYVLPPARKGSLTAGVTLYEQRLTLGARLRFEDNEGRGGSAYEDVVDWQVFDLWASVRLFDSLALRLAVDNLRDHNYAEANGTSYWIAPGRTLSATLSLTF